MITWRNNLLLVAAVSMSACAGNVVTSSDTQDQFGVIVMAHGGNQDWNNMVEQVVAPLQSGQPVALAFGMADAQRMELAVRQLESHGSQRIGVVRLFVSGESFLNETQQILGLAPGAPDKAATISTGNEVHTGHAMHEEHVMRFWKIDSQASFALSMDGLLEAEEVADILADRARTLSKQPQRERVLILGHGPGDDAENARWLAAMQKRAESVQKILPFKEVMVATLREDWPQARTEAEQRIRAWVEKSTMAGDQVLVIPFRVAGFGPYAKVLEGLDYIADGKGFLPHPRMSDWLHRQIKTLREQHASI